MKASAHSLRDDVYYYFIKVPHSGYFSDFTEFENETKGSTMDYDCQLGSKIKEELWARTGRMHPEEVPKYYGKKAVIWMSIGVPIYDDPVLILPEEKQDKKNRKRKLKILVNNTEKEHSIHGIGKIEVLE